MRCTYFVVTASISLCRSIVGSISRGGLVWRTKVIQTNCSSVNIASTRHAMSLLAASLPQVRLHQVMRPRCGYSPRKTGLIHCGMWVALGIHFHWSINWRMGNWPIRSLSTTVWPYTNRKPPEKYQKLTVHGKVEILKGTEVQIFINHCGTRLFSLYTSVQKETELFK
jgi:hypothetical protein